MPFYCRFTHTKDDNVFGHKLGIDVYVASSGGLVPMYNEIANLS
jgi:hypothetical protein